MEAEVETTKIKLDKLTCLHSLHSSINTLQMVQPYNIDEFLAYFDLAYFVPRSVDLTDNATLPSTNEILIVTTNIVDIQLKIQFPYAH